MTSKDISTKTLSRWGRLAAMALALGAVTASPLSAQAQPTSGAAVSVDQDDSSYAGYVTVPLSKSRILRVNSSVQELLIGNPDVADVMPLTNKSVYVLGKSIGSTSLSILGPGKKLIAVVDIRVSHDTRSLKRDLFEILPDQVIEVRAANDSIILSGMVDSSADASQAAAIAERYAPGRVSNFLGVSNSQQVMLSVRFAEVKRNLAKQLGLRSEVSWDNGGGHTAGMVSGIINPDAFATLTGTKFIGEADVELMLDALEEKGIVTTLAEPTLIAKSGETANFLAGGEFPVPVPRTTNGSDESNSISIEFKEYGASLAFTPTVLGDNISLIVEPEVSQLDFQSSIELGGYRVPGLTTRRAKTSVEMKNGQSFAIAGLLQSEFTDKVSQIPGIGDVPILGALARSAEFERNETELVIIITPHFVKPVNPKDLKLPTDYVVKPHDLELFLAGVVESSRLKHYEGIDGAVGYIIE
ncbi:MAG: type II and III secretion system protein family protein [Alphaproteobacteria bacterium]|nr:MAG: type II and III secretion system protein family protein [Alphaproteobacteria bacterium]